MTLSQSRFYKSDTLFRGADDVLRCATIYSYETGKALYDVLAIDAGIGKPRMRFARVNMGRLSPLISDWTPIHYEIEHYFRLNG